jgi:tetratricopeptide (TPR) repeat protein
MYQTFLEQGNHEFKRGKYRAALNSYSKAIARNPQLVEAHYGCGLAAEKLGKHKLAQDCFTTVVRLKAKSPSNEEISSTLMKELSSPREANRDESSQQSAFGGIAVFFFLVTMILRTVAIIGYISDQSSFDSQPEINSEATESVLFKTDS